MSWEAFLLIGLCPNCWAFLLSSQTLLNNQQHNMNSVLANIWTKPHQYLLAVIKESLLYKGYLQEELSGSSSMSFFKQEIFKTIEEEVWFNQTSLSLMLAGATKHVHTSTPPWLTKFMTQTKQLVFTCWQLHLSFIVCTSPQARHRYFMDFLKKCLGCSPTKPLGYTSPSAYVQPVCDATVVFFSENMVFQ